MRRALIVMAAVAVIAGCSNDGGSGPIEITSGTTPAGEPAALATTPEPSSRTTEPDPTTKPRPSAKTFTMPKVTGKNLQAAQDELQSRGSYLMDQSDATGEARLQLQDNNWKVCTQTPKPGAQVKVSVVVKLAAVKLDEPCP